MKRRNHQAPIAHVFEELEPRIMYSADFAPALADDAGWMPQAEVRSLDDDADTSFASQDIAADIREVFFVDAGVKNYVQLIGDIQRTHDVQRYAEIVVLDGTLDGVDQISQALAQRSGVSAVHIISHGDNATLKLGSALLSADTLVQYRDAISQWRNALSADADILLYGCDVASDSSGHAFVQQLAQLTGADVAASVDVTGNRERGRDWELELHVGAIETEALGFGNVAMAWRGTLATYYLQGDVAPPFSGLSVATPTATTLANFDPGRDATVGLIIAKGGVGAAESDPVKHHTWVASAGPVIMSNDPVSLVFWTDMKDGMNGSQTSDMVQGKSGTVTAYLMDLANPTATTGAVIASGSISDPTWGDGFAWEEKSIDFGNISYTIAAGRHLGVKFVVDSGDDDLWFAYDTTAFQSRLLIAEPNLVPVILSNGGGAGASVNVAENTTAVTIVAAGDADLPAQTLTYSIIGGADSARLNISSTTGVLSFNAPPDFEAPLDTGTNNVYEVTVQVADVLGGSDTQTLSVTVTNANDAPTLANAIADQAATEDAAFSFTFAANTFSDVDVSDSLTYSASGVPAWLSFDAATRTFSGTPANADVGTASLTVRATDLSGAFVQDTFDIVVANANDAPTLANAIADQAATEDAAFSFTFAANTFNDVDVSDSLTYSASGVPAWLSFDAATRTFSGTPANADVGTASLTVRATDLSGAFVEETFDLVVANANDAPSVSTIANQTLSEDGSSAILDFIIGDAETSPNALIVSAQSSNQAIVSDRDIVLGGSGAARNIQITPLANAYGTVTITLQVSDGLSTTQSTFNVNVLPLNDAPVASDNAYSIDEDTVLNINANGILQDDIDLDRDTLSASLASAPTHGSLVLNADGSLRYRPNADFNGIDTFSYRVSDGASDSNIATVTVNVAAVNDAPTIVANALTLSEGGHSALTLRGTQLTTADVDNTATQLMYTVIEAPINGQLELITNRGVGITQFTQADIDASRLRYVGNHAQSGSDSFTFIVSDGSDTTVAASFVISRNAPDPSPIVPPNISAVDLVLPSAPPPPPQPTLASVTNEPATQSEQDEPAAGASPVLVFDRSVDDQQSQPATRVIDAPGTATSEQSAVRVAIDGSTLRRTRESFASTPIKVAQTTVSDALQPQLAGALGSSSSHSPAVGEELSDSRYVQKLNDVRDQIQEHLAIDQRVVASSIAVSTGFSVGYVIWLLRGGVLLSSMLSSLPAWGMVDPLPVLGKLKDDDEEEDQESLQDMLKRVRNRNPARPVSSTVIARAEIGEALGLGSPRFLHELATGGA